MSVVFGFFPPFMCVCMSMFICSSSTCQCLLHTEHIKNVVEFNIVHFYFSFNNICYKILLFFLVDILYEHIKLLSWCKKEKRSQKKILTFFFTFSIFFYILFGLLLRVILWQTFHTFFLPSSIFMYFFLYGWFLWAHFFVCVNHKKVCSFKRWKFLIK